MAAPPVLLVADDLAVIASVKRVLAREGYECVLATNAADAIIAWGHGLPGLVVLQPSVESDRGAVVLEELAAHPEARLLRVVLLGESVPGFPWPVEPLPLDAQAFAQTIADNFRTADRLDGWKVLETTPARPAVMSEPAPGEPEAWRATSPAQPLSPTETLDDDFEPRLEALAVPRAEVPADELSPEAGELPTPPDGTPAAAPTPPHGHPGHGALHDAAESLAEAPATDTTDDGREGAEAARSADIASSGEGSAATEAPWDGVESLADAATAPDPGTQGEGPGTEAPGEPAAPPADAGAEAGAEAAWEGEAPSLDATWAGAASSAEAAWESEASLADAGAVPQEGQDSTPEAPGAATPGTDTQWRGVEAPPSPGLADRLFDDLPSLEDELHRDVEAQVRASVESTLAGAPVDDELQRLEDEVRAEAQRRRVAREERAQAVAPTQQAQAVEAPLPSADVGDTAGESDFGELSDGPAPPPAAPSRAAEMLARAEQLLLEGRAAAEARRREAEVDAKKRQADLDATERRAEHAEALVRKEREARAALEEALERAREELAAAGADAQAANAQAARALGSEAAQRRALEERLAEAQAQLAQATRERDEKAAALEEFQVESEVLQSQLESDAAAAKRLEGELAAAQEDARRVAEALQAELAQARADAQRALAELRAEVATARDEAQAEQQRARAEVTAAREQAAADQRRADAAERSLAEAVEARDEAREALAKLTQRATTLEADLGTTTDKLDEATRERDELRAALGVTQGDLERTTGELERALQEIAGLTRAAEEARAAATASAEALEEQRTRAESAEDRAALAQEKVATLEKRAVVNLALPGKRTVGVPRTGTVDLAGLAGLVGQLVVAQADERLELGVPGGRRTLWFKRGAVIAAESTLEHESLVDRARRDGLIDARQEAELRMLKTATPREQLDALKARGAIRDIEAVPLVQRYTEQTALEAFTEPTTSYRLADEPPGDAVLLATVPRPTLPMLAESLRRAVPPDALLEQLGGGEAVPVATDAELDLRALGFSERERKMLTWVDGEATVEDLSLASGLRPDAAFRALLVAKLLGLLEVTLPDKPPAPVDPDLDVRRLEAKYDEVQDADYFTILGLPRSAGAEDVQRAFRRLGDEFDPLRFSGHPDPSLQQRAQVVFRLLEEAARALEDDRRRAEYARHLLD